MYICNDRECRRWNGPSVCVEASVKSLSTKSPVGGIVNGSKGVCVDVWMGRGGDMGVEENGVDDASGVNEMDGECECEVASEALVDGVNNEGVCEAQVDGVNNEGVCVSEKVIAGGVEADVRGM